MPCICNKCIGDGYLRAQVHLFSENKKCSYCDKTGVCADLNDLAPLIEDAFSRHYYLTSDQPDDYEWMLLKDKESSYEWERSGEPAVYAIMNSADLPEQAAEDIQKILEEKNYDHEAAKMGDESEFAPDSYYQLRTINEGKLLNKWYEIEKSLTTQTRFFNNDAYETLESIFSGILRMETPDGHPIIVEAGPNKNIQEFYRARTFDSHRELQEALKKPETSLASPPLHCAKAGRMNAHGISVFYGADNPHTAIAETRPSIAAQSVVARFEIIRDLRLLDLTSFTSIGVHGNIFDPGYKSRLEQVAFLKRLSEIISRPISRYNESLEYISTQAISDFLSSNEKFNLDGLLFSSAQVNDETKNCILFHNASEVEEISRPANVQIGVNTVSHDEDGSYHDYCVHEFGDFRKGEYSETHYPLLGKLPSNEPALRIDLESVNVHHIESVNFTSDSHKVSYCKDRDYKFDTHDSSD